MSRTLSVCHPNTSGGTRTANFSTDGADRTSGEKKNTCLFHRWCRLNVWLNNSGKFVQTKRLMEQEWQIVQALRERNSQKKRPKNA